jgi:hypothetical protein
MPRNANGRTAPTTDLDLSRLEPRDLRELLDACQSVVDLVGCYDHNEPDVVERAVLALAVVERLTRPPRHDDGGQKP